MATFVPPLDVTELEEAFRSLRGIEIINIVKSGGQGVVAKVILQGCLAALKVFTPESQARGSREIELLGSLKTSSIVPLVDFGDIHLRGQKCRFVITKFVEGIDLRSLLQNGGTLDEPECKQFLREVADALLELWKMRIVHRDIKPDNIIRGVDGRFILVDLGIAKGLDMPTITQLWVGTPGYMSPEQAMGKRNLTVKADIFSLGVTAYELLTRAHPFCSSQEGIMNGCVPNRPEDIVCCSTLLSDVIMWMLSSSPLGRPMPAEIIERL